MQRPLVLRDAGKAVVRVDAQMGAGGVMRRSRTLAGSPHLQNGAGADWTIRRRGEALTSDGCVRLCDGTARWAGTNNVSALDGTLTVWLRAGCTGLSSLFPVWWTRSSESVLYLVAHRSMAFWRSLGRLCAGKMKSSLANASFPALVNWAPLQQPLPRGRLAQPGSRPSTYSRRRCRGAPGGLAADSYGGARDEALQGTSVTALAHEYPHSVGVVPFPSHASVKPDTPPAALQPAARTTAARVRGRGAMSFISRPLALAASSALVISSIY